MELGREPGKNLMVPERGHRRGKLKDPKMESLREEGSEGSERIKSKQHCWTRETTLS